MRKTIIRLEGGLGNQLFQYAFGRQLAYEHNTALQLDTSSYNDDSLRNCALTEYEINAEFVNSSQQFFLEILFNCLDYPTIGRLLECICEREKKVFQYQFVERNRSYYIGYWQHLNYFSNIRDILSKEIVYKGALSTKARGLLDDIETSNSVAIHVRRGDYLYLDDYCVLGVEYYNNSINYIKEHSDDVKLVIFSDDIEWCRNNLVVDAIYVGEEYESNQYIDFELMKQCKHHIIGNSTFSWWASWLSNNVESINIAPKTWFTNQELNDRVHEALLHDYVII